MVGQLRRYRLPALLTGLVLLAVVAATVLAAQARSTEDSLLDQLERHSHPLESVEPDGDLSDLHPLGEMVGDAAVVGVGEATHSSREFFTTKHRVFRYLVENHGFTTFGLETNWSAGLRLNRYVLDGEGDARQIMHEEFPEFWVQPWNTREYLDLIEWMRAYNQTHADKVRFMAFDTYYPAEVVIDEVIGYVEDHYPDLLAQVTEHYQALRPSDLTTFMTEHWDTAVPERHAQAEQARQVLDLLERQDPGPDPEGLSWAVQHATVLHQTASLWAFDIEDPEAGPRAMEYRDQVMADNVAWWHEQTGDRILVSAHNGHIANETLEPEAYPKVQGTFLRERLGDGYLSVGFTFNQGSFNALESAETSADSVGIQPQAFTLAPAEPGSNEHVLDQVSHQNYLIDLRTAPHEVRDWLRGSRPTRDTGTSWPVPVQHASLAASYDILIHLHEVTAAQLRS
jgi:erythromycin esterase